MSATLEPPDTSALSIDSTENRAANAWTGRGLNPWRAKAIEENAGTSLLDVGCGNGQYVFHFRDHCRTAGIDIQSYPQWAEDSERFQVADAYNLPFDNQSFETVTSFETLEHVPDPERALREFHRVCRKNVIISVPNCELPQALEQSRLTYFHYTDQSHVNFFTSAELEKLLLATGFQPTSITLINPCPLKPLLSHLFPMPGLLSRLVERLAARNPLKMTILAVADRKS